MPEFAVEVRPDGVQKGETAAITFLSPVAAGYPVLANHLGNGADGHQALDNLFHWSPRPNQGWLIGSTVISLNPDDDRIA